MATPAAASDPILEVLAGRPPPRPKYFVPKFALIWKIPEGEPLVISGL